MDRTQSAMSARERPKLSLLENKCWADIRTPPDGSKGKPCLFLDRDGVVIEDEGYQSDPNAIVIIPGASDVIRSANQKGWVCGMVTNQSGIGRGYYTWADFEAVQSEVNRLLEEDGCRIDFVLACPHHPDAEIPEFRHKNHPWRKPNPGMIEYAAQAYDIDIEHSSMIGDKLSDLEAAKEAGLTHAVHVLSGQEQLSPDQVQQLQSASFHVEQISSIKNFRLR